MRRVRPGSFPTAARATISAKRELGRAKSWSRTRGGPVPQVSFTNNLQRHLSCPTVSVTGDTVHAVLHGVFETNPKLRPYLLDDQGRLRRHVKVFVNDRAVADRSGLSDRVVEADEVFALQALWGG